MADFLNEKRTEIDQRLKELRPMHEEYLKLEQAKAALDGLGETSRRGPGRPRGSGGTRRRRRRGGTRAEQALQHVRENPGITVADLAERMNIQQRNYLYRVMGSLESDGAVIKEGRGYVAT
jgi:hypothetical protein